MRRRALKLASKGCDVLVLCIRGCKCHSDEWDIVERIDYESHVLVVVVAIDAEVLWDAGL